MLTESGGHGEKRSRKKEQAISALLANSTIGGAAKACRVHPATIRRWLKDPTFAAEYATARKRTLELASESLKYGTLAAVTVLQTIAEDRRAPAAARVSACRSFLECTGLLRGTAVTVNNHVLPTDSESLDQLLLEKLSSMLSQDQRFRQTVRGLIEDIEEKNDGGLLN